jgi:hypothetical protein
MAPSIKKQMSRILNSAKLSNFRELYSAKLQYFKELDSVELQVHFTNSHAGRWIIPFLSGMAYKNNILNFSIKSFPTSAILANSFHLLEVPPKNLR